MACGVFDLGCSVWDLVPQPGKEPCPLQWELRVLVTEPPRKAHLFLSKLRQHNKKQRHYFVNKSPSTQGYGFSSGHVWMWELDYKESAEELMLLNCGVGEDSWESLGLQGDPTSPS